MESLGKPRRYRLFKRQESAIDDISHREGVKGATVMRWAVDFYLAHKRGKMVLEEPPTSGERERVRAAVVGKKKKGAR